MCDVAELLHAPMAFHLFIWRITGGCGTEPLGLARFVSARVLPTMGRGSLHQGRSSGIFVAAVICDALRWTAHVTQGMISSVLTVWKEGRCRKGIMDGLRKFITVDNHDAVWGGLRQGIESFQVVQPMFTAGFSSEVIREEADEVTLRAHEEGVRRTFIDTTNSGTIDRGPAGRCGLACLLPGHLPGNRGTRVGSDVLPP